MDAIFRPGTEKVVVMSSAQVGKTEILLNIVGYCIDRDPSSVMLLEPTVEMAETVSKDRVAPMIRDTPCLAAKVREARSRDSSNTILHKKYLGGYLVVSGANSAASLSSRPIRILLADEVDRYPPSAGTEGDPLGLAEKRTLTYWNRKLVYVSTPTIRGISRIEKEYEHSTKETWQYACPGCGRRQPLRFAHLEFESLGHRCPFCGGIFGEFEWKARLGEWVAEAESPVRGFRLSALSSPWYHWDQIVGDFRRAKKDGAEALKVFVNTVLGELWEEEGDEIEDAALESHRETYGVEVPGEVLVLTAGVDVQDDRLEAEIVGWGTGKRSWGIEYRVLPGDPGQPEVWEQLRQLLMRTWTRGDGRRMGILVTCIDSGGHHTTDVYRFCLALEQRRIYAIKGRGGPGVPLIGKPSRSNRVGCALFPIGVDAAKEALFRSLRVEDPDEAGYCRFPKDANRGYDETWFRGLTSERRVIRYRKGQAHVEWEKRTGGARNEPLDCRVYARAALEILNPNLELLAAQGGWSVPASVSGYSQAGRRRIVSRGVY
jgi:phage terminase large subunit GpA-like protein